MRKKYAVPIIIYLSFVMGLLAFCYYGLEEQMEHRFLKEGWQYSWDTDKQQLSGKEGQWNALPFLESPEGRNGRTELWLRILLPPEPAHNPVLFLKNITQSFTVFVEGEEVYRYGTLAVQQKEKLNWLPWHIITLPDQAAGNRVYIHVSSTSTGIGIAGIAEYGTMQGLFKHKIAMDLLKVSALFLMLAAGLLAILVYFCYLREKVYLAFAGNALGAAATIVGTTFSSFLFYPNPEFWNNWLLVSNLCWKVFWLQFFAHIVDDEYRIAALWLLGVTSVITCVQIVAALLNPGWAYSIFASNIFYVAVCFIIVLYFCRNQLRFNREAQLYAAGMTVYLAVALLDNLSALRLIFMPTMLGWIGQLSEVSGLAAILILRNVKVHRQLRQYSEELKEFNRNLESMIQARTNELSIQNACLEQLFDNSPDAIVMLDLQYRIISCNPAFEGLFGYSLEEAKDCPVSQLLGITSEEPAAEHLFECLGRKKRDYEDVVRRHKNGSLIPVSLTAYPFITQTTQVGVYIIYRDISRRLIAEEILRNGEQKYRLLAENIEGIIWLVDFDKQLLYVSPSLKRFTGFTLAEYLKRPFDEQITPSLQAAIDEVIEAYYQGKEDQSPVLLEEEIYDKGGRRMWLESSIRIAHGEDGQLLGLIGISRDITSRKRTERLLAYSYERKRRNQFFTAVVEEVIATEQEIYAQARQVRVNLPQEFSLWFCLIHTDYNLVAEPDQQERMKDEITDMLNWQDGFVAWNAVDGVGIVYNLRHHSECPQSEAEAAEVCLQTLEAAHPGVKFTIGVAETSHCLADFSRQFRHACSAARIGRQKNGSSSIQYYRDCGIYEVFDSFAETKEAVAFVDKTLGPLIEYDLNNNTELVDTLEKILSGSSLKDLSEQMFIHQKTISSRRQRIEKILLVSLESFDDRMRLGAAFQIKKLLAARKW